MCEYGAREREADGTGSSGDEPVAGVGMGGELMGDGGCHFWRGVDGGVMLDWGASASASA